MKIYFFLIILINLFFRVPTASFSQSDSIQFKKIYNEVLTNSKCYANLDYLSNKIGGRLSGSPQTQKAVDWAFKAMKEAGADTVFLQECMVPHWVRGEKEVGQVFSSGTKEVKTLAICALGGSIATAENGITAKIVEVKNFEELATLGKKEVEGKIIFYNQAMDPTFIETFKAYSKAVLFRWAGAAEAAKYGAIAVIVRSCTHAHDENPHTGVMKYKESITKIPACAISTNGADWLSNELKKNTDLKFYLKMNCQTLPDEKSYNVIGEIRGSEKSKEYIVVGGHLDSWDTGDGAQDDGAGIVQSIEIIRTYKALGIKPKRTLRAVAFMNEENGGRGGDRYAELAKINKEKHIVAIESDEGGFSPRGFSLEMKTELKNKIKNWIPLFLPYGVYDFTQSGGGSDIDPLNEVFDTPLIGLVPDSQRYFDYHHAPTDTFETVNKRELELGAASIAALIWMISEYGL